MTNRSRQGWDAMDEVPPEPPAHTHRLPKVVRVALIMLVFSQVLTLIGLGISTVYNYRQQQYIDGKSEQRDRERAALERLMRDLDRQAVCDLLDQLPEGGLLDRPRAKYDCGPGIPLADLTPDEQAQLSGRGRAAAIPPPPVTVQPPTPGLGAPAAPNPPRRSANEPPPRNARPESAPEPSPEPGPPADPTPVTDLVCGLVDVCP